MSKAVDRDDFERVRALENSWEVNAHFFELAATKVQSLLRVDAVAGILIGP